MNFQHTSSPPHSWGRYPKVKHSRVLNMYWRNELPVTAKPMKKRLPLAMPVDFPQFMLNTLTVKAFNELYYHAQLPKRVHKVVSYDPFFYPLDWSSGRNG